MSEASDGRTIQWGRGHVLHGRTPVWLLDADVSDRAIRLYALLATYADAEGRSFPGRKLLMERLRCGKTALDAAMKDLERVGALTVEASWREDGGRTSNNYFLAWSNADPPSLRGGIPPSRVDEGAIELVPVRTSTRDSLRSSLVGAPASVDRKPVKEGERDLAEEVLNEWNAQTGQSLTSADWLRRIIMRIREHPELTAYEHSHIIAEALRDPWWRGAASPSVVYGNGAIFEKSLMAAAGNLGPRQQTAGDRIEATIAQLRREGR